jgi:hypothetical protein
MGLLGTLGSIIVGIIVLIIIIAIIALLVKIGFYDNFGYNHRYGILDLRQNKG